MSVPKHRLFEGQMKISIKDPHIRFLHDLTMELYITNICNDKLQFKVFLCNFLQLKQMYKTKKTSKSKFA